MILLLRVQLIPFVPLEWICSYFLLFPPLPSTRPSSPPLCNVSWTGKENSCPPNVAQQTLVSEKYKLHL